MNFWYPNESYVEYLRQFESGILNLKDDDYKVPKFCIGTVLKVNEINYFAPISGIKEEKQLSKFDNLSLNDFFSKFCFPIKTDRFGPDRIVSTVKFNYMFPVHHKDLEYVNTKKFPEYKFTTGYQKLVVSEFNFCERHKSQIKEMAKKVYDNAISKTDDFDKYCLDFKLLEVKYDEWINSDQFKQPKKFPIPTTDKKKI